MIKDWMITAIMVLLPCVILFESCHSKQIEGTLLVEREPLIEPDYYNVTIPRNIAPLNFKINESGNTFRIKVYSSDGTTFWLKSSDGIVRFPITKWKNLLAECTGDTLFIEVFSKNKENETTGYQPIRLFVEEETLDPYLCYRLFYPGYETWNQIKIIQRSLEDFNESSIIENQVLSRNCVNCHAFNNNNPEKFLVHIRGSEGGTYFTDGKTITRRDLKTEEMAAGATYPAWHPSGQYVAFSSNNVRQSFLAIREKDIEVFDLASSLVLYDTRKNEMIPVVEKDTMLYMETFPEWSPDGNYLYYCRADQFTDGSDFQSIKYNLVRKPFNRESGSFGTTEMVFDARAMDKSVSFPRISPDGKYLVFTLHNFGTFSIWHKEADLYLMDLQKGNISHMNLNSDESESYHAWSSNSRWLVFSSKRADGLTARPYFAYVGSPEHVGKPFVLPQKDPMLYNNLLETFNKPEFTTGKIDLGPRDYRRASKKDAIKAKWNNESGEEK